MSFSEKQKLLEFKKKNGQSESLFVASDFGSLQWEF